MTPDRWKRIERLYHEALERNAAERAAFLTDACSGDDALRLEVESLLAHDGEAAFLSTPAVTTDGTTLAGQALGPYLISARIGEGGMGEVYQARDPKLGRDVAIKVLPRIFTSDPERLARFEREARVLAALNHPHIGAIYGVEENNGVRALVLELVEGPTLAERLARGPLPMTEALGIARQIAEALEAAHDKGIIHRDLKPANVKITPAGSVKVLDFGLAKAIDGGTGQSAAPTIAADATEAGRVVGTAAYMSPEQARGQPVDRRTDIWALGCVMYEMFTGHKAFARETFTDTLAAVVEGEPDWALLPSETSVEARQLVERCLRKDARHRLRDIGEARIRLEELSAVVSSRERPATYRSLASDSTRAGTATRIRSRPLALAGAIFGVAIVATVIAWRASLPAGDDPRAVRTLAVLPLKSLAGNTDENYIGVAIADSIIMGVSRASSLTVRPTSAVLRYAGQTADPFEAARTLGVDAVLDGTWLREGDQLRLSINLLQVSDGRSLWTDSFDARAGDVFAIQDQVSKGLVSRLRLQVDRAQPALRRRPAPNSGAYDAYAKAMFYFADRGTTPQTRAKSDTAIELFERAIGLDPEYAEAHAMLGYAYAWTAVFIEDNPTLIARGEEETRVAEQIDPSLGQIHLTRGFILWSWYRGWRIVEAIQEFRRAREMDPGLPDLELGILYHHMGLFDEWRENAERTLELDPTNNRMKRAYVNEHYQANLPDEGLAAQRRLLNTGPDARYFLLTGRVVEAESIAEREAAENPLPGALIRLALLRALQGRQREAQDLVPRILAVTPKNRTYHHITYDLARVFALGGRGADAAWWLDETVRWGMPSYPMFISDKLLDSVRSTPEMKTFMTGLKAQWDRYRAQLP